MRFLPEQPDRLLVWAKQAAILRGHPVIVQIN
jgi:hypothetical protein